MTAFLLGAFGFPEVHADDRPIKLNLRKGLALLIYLGEANGAVARDVLATLLWPETSREIGLARLRAASSYRARARPGDLRGGPQQRAMVSGD